MILPPAFLSQAVLAGMVLLSSNNEPIPILDVVKVYGSLAGQQCYGEKLAPPGSSCLIRYEELRDKLGLTTSTDSFITKRELGIKLASLKNFQWPLKPYGVDKSLEKTSTMNKGAETKVYMEELESRGLYDGRNPIGPLPTSLRPRLNAALQREGLEHTDATVDRVFQILGGNAKTNELSVDQLRSKVFPERSYLDYYDFLGLVGKERVYWPQ